MKRLVLLSMLCAFVFGVAATASAADIKASGKYTFEAIWSNQSFEDDNSDTKFDVYQRLRTKFEFIANENLKGVLYTEVGTSTWGEEMQSGSNIKADKTDEGAVEIKAGYIDFNWPGTQQNIKVGQLGVTLPNAIGGSSMILDDELPTAMISGPITDHVAYMLGWHRLQKNSSTSDLDDDAALDAVSVALPLNFDGVSIQPFMVYGYGGDNYTVDYGVDEKAVEIDNVWWTGVAFELTMFDPFVFKADLNYGNADVEDKEDANGWYFGAALEYKGFDFMTPEVFFAWTSGDDDDADYKGEGQMPIMPGSTGDWALGSFFFGGDWGLKGSIDADDTALGFWTLGVSLKDISFFEGLTHTVNVLYIKGTNDEDNAVTSDTSRSYLTEEDSLFEVDLNSAYSIYDELTAYVELGWIAEDFDGKRDSGSDDAWKVSTGLNYKF